MQRTIYSIQQALYSIQQALSGFQDLRRNLCCTLLVALSLSGCVGTPSDSNRPLPEVIDAGEDANANPNAPPVVLNPNAPEAAPTPSFATLALLDQSERLRSDGDLPAAIAAVERAIRLEPNNPKLWLQLGQLQLSAGEDAQAEQLVRKSIALVRNDPQTERDAWLTLADINEARGDIAQARELRRRWQSGPG